MTNLTCKWSSAISLHPYMARSGWMTIHRHWRLPKDTNSVSLFLQIWQHKMPTLNQRLGCFPIESRVEFFSQCRQDCPLPPPINRRGFQALREQKTGSKVSHKISLFPVSATFSLSPPLQTPSHVATSSTKGSQHNHLSATKQPLGISLSSPSGISLSFANLFLLPPTAYSGHHSLIWCLLSDRSKHLITSETPTPGNLLHPCLASTFPVLPALVVACRIHFACSDQNN